MKLFLLLFELLSFLFEFPERKVILHFELSEIVNVFYEYPRVSSHSKGVFKGVEPYPVFVLDNIFVLQVDVNPLI